MISCPNKSIGERVAESMFCLKRIVYIVLLIFNCSYICKTKSINRPLKILIFETYFLPKLAQLYSVKLLAYWIAHALLLDSPLIL